MADCFALDASSGYERMVTFGCHPFSACMDTTMSLDHTKYDLDQSPSPGLQRLMAQTLWLLGVTEPPASEQLLGAMPQKTYRDLQWSQLIEAITRETVTPEGAQIVADLRPLDDRAAVELRLAEIRQCMELLETDEEPPLRGLRDIRKAIAHARRGGTLGADDLEAVGKNGDVAARCIRYFQSRAQRARTFAEAAGLLDACSELRAALAHAIEPGGRLADRASADLGRLRRTVQNQHDRIGTKVESLLRSEQLENHLQDDYFTVREERYVLPIRVGAKTIVQGIVHGYSSSGQTAYIEPTELVELNNQLRWAQIELAEEEQRILERLSALVSNFAPALSRNVEVLAYLDVVTACAKFGRRIRATVPTISDEGIALRQARHPLLFLKMERTRDGQRFNDTEPNDVILDPKARVLIVSGPNTGGKTVALKTAGLCALMVRFGLPLPVAEESQIPLFETIFTDIGDEQSIERDLSTFSGHVVNINQFLGRCDEQSLVLLDELFTGTDPMQGAALAVSLLEALAARNTTTIVTTHLEGLKTLAYQNEHFANASMGFDIQTLTPTYQMTMGIPGSSFAVRIAARLGLPDELIERARQVLEGQDHHSVEEVLARLEDQMSELQKEQRRLQHTRHEAEKAQIKFKEKYASLLSAERESIFADTRKVREQLREARSLIRDKVKELQAARVVERGDFTQQELQRMRDELQQSEQILERASEYTRPAQASLDGRVRVQPDELEQGMRVFSATFKRDGVVNKFTPGDDQAIVQIGDLKASVDLSTLYYATETERRTHMRGRPLSAAPTTDGPAPSDILLPQTSDNTVDLRGMRADEALEKLDFFLDAAYLHNIDGVYIIHGHGTGALKRAVRGQLPQSPYVRDFRRGEREEGGDGVTVAFLKRQG